MTSRGVQTQLLRLYIAVKKLFLSHLFVMFASITVVVMLMSPKGRKANKLTMCSDEARGLLVVSNHGAV